MLARIDRFNPEYKAFVRVDAEGALAAARASEARWRDKSALSPLDGVPVSIKDLILTKGLPTLRGSFTVDENQPLGVLGKDINTMQLGKGTAKWLLLFDSQGSIHLRIGARPCRVVIAERGLERRVDRI